VPQGEESPSARVGPSRRILLNPPPVEGHPVVKLDVLKVEATAQTVLAYQFNSPIFKYPNPRTIIGFVRRGQRLPIARWSNGEGCDGGRWYELAQGGYVCTQEGFSVTKQELPEEFQTPAPDLDDPLPFDYAKVNEADTPVYSRIPTAIEEQAASVAGATPEPVQFRTQGVVLFALDRTVTRDDGVVFVRNVHGDYVREAAITRKPAPTMVGELLSSTEDLPIAFVWQSSAPVLDETGRMLIGEALKFSRFAAPSKRILQGIEYVNTEHGLVPRTSVRLAQVVARPERIPSNSQWIHVDLGEQVLVAYEGDRPVRTTLVSTGKEGYEPPLGVFQVVKKFTTKTMAGEDIVDGSYDVDQVPWIMYYWGALALHGAYWHDGFGDVRSHGCTNIPPVDAQWLFAWAKPTLPAGWQGKVSIRGPWVYVTNSSSSPSATP